MKYPHGTGKHTGLKKHWIYYTETGNERINYRRYRYRYHVLGSLVYNSSTNDATIRKSDSVMFILIMTLLIGDTATRIEFPDYYPTYQVCMDAANQTKMKTSENGTVGLITCKKVI